MSNELNITIYKNSQWKTMYPNYLLEEKVGYMTRIMCSFAGYKMTHLAKFFNNKKIHYPIMFFF